MNGHECHIFKSMARLNHHIILDTKLQGIHNSMDPKVWHRTNNPVFDLDEDAIKLGEKVKINFMFGILNRKAFDLFKDINLTDNPEKIYMHGKRVKHHLNT